MKLPIAFSLAALVAFLASGARAAEANQVPNHTHNVTFVVHDAWIRREGDNGVLYFDSPDHKATVSFVIVREKLTPAMAEGGSLQMTEDGRPAPGANTTVSGFKAFKFITAKEVMGETQWLTTIAILIDDQHLGLCHITTYDSTPAETKAEADALAASIKIETSPITPRDR